MFRFGLRKLTFVYILGTILTGSIIGSPVGSESTLERQKRETRQVGRPYAEVRDGHASAAVLSLDSPGVKGDVLYGKAGLDRKTGIGVGAGLAEFNMQASGATVDYSFLSASYEGNPVNFCLPYLVETDHKCGVMGRLKLIDATTSYGPGRFGLGVTLDSGATFDGRNFEGKILGTGGKIGRDGLEVCITVICFGINWKI